MHPSLTVLEERCYSVPNILRTLDISTHSRFVKLLADGAPIFTTGIGASEGPARLLASCLSGKHRDAKFIPLSGLLAADHRAYIGESNSSRLVVFSQGISPNARLAIDMGQEFVSTMIVTGAEMPVRERGQRSWEVLRHPPENETGFLVRAAGPAVASALAMAIASRVVNVAHEGDVVAYLRQCADVMEARLREEPNCVDLLEKPPAFLVVGRDGVERNHLLRWTLLECFDAYDPPVWDIMAFAHGAFQNTFKDARTLILPYSRQDAGVLPIVSRLREMLRQTRHTLIEVPSELPRPWCLLEHLAFTQALLLAHLRRHPRDLNDWPGRGKDAAIYGLDSLPST